MRKTALSLLVLMPFSPAALADETHSSLPSLALDPAPTYWSGWSVGSEMTASFGKGTKGRIGGGGFVAYTHALENDFSIGLSASAGYSPFSLKDSPYKGVNYGSTQVKLSYDMGQLKPYISGGLLVTRPNSAFNAGPDQSLNDLFANSRGMKTSGVVGAGFDYQINSQLSLGLGVQVGTGPAGFSR